MTGGAWAATGVNWGGGSGGTEADPLDVYDLSNWSGVSELSIAYDLTFDVGNVPTVLTNSCTTAATTQIANNLNLKYGTWTLLGDYKFSTFDTLASGTEPKVTTVVKKGDWELTWAAYLGRSGSTAIITNESGNIVQSAPKWFQIGNGGGGLAVVENLSGDWTLAGQLAVGHGTSSAGEIYWRGGDLESNHSSGPNFALGASTTAHVEKDAGDWTMKKLTLGDGAESEATFIHRGGSMTVSGDFIASVGSNSVVTIEKDAGDWTLANLKLGQGANNVYSEAKTTFKHNGGATSVSVRFDMSNFGSCDFYMNGGTVTAGEVWFGTWMLRDKWHHATIHLAGGVFAAKCFYLHNSDKANLSKVVFDGGTFRATTSGNMIYGNDSRYNLDDSSKLSDLRNRFGVEVGSRGGTIDTAGYDITNAVNIAGGSGGMRFVGGGSVVLTGAIGYTGKTSVEVGTKLEVTDASAKNTILNTRGLDIVGYAASGDYTVFTYEGGLDAETDLRKVTCTFAPDSTFEIVGNSIVCHYVKPAVNYWTGARDNNLSDAANWSGGVVPTENALLSLASPAKLMVGDTFAPSTLTINDGSAVVTIGTGDLHISGSLTNASKLAIASGVSLTVDGDLVVCEGKGTFLHSNEGMVTVGGNAVCTSGTTAKQYDVITENTNPIKVGGFLFDRAESRTYFRLESGSVGPGMWVVGAEGFKFKTTVGENQARFYAQNSPVMLYSSDDWTLFNTGLNGTGNGDLQVTPDSLLTINTSDYTDSKVKRTITLEGRINAQGDITIAGCGTVIIATTAHNGLTDTTIASGKTIAVTDTATLQVNAGKKILGEGTISLGAGTTLALKSTGREFETPEIVPVKLPADGSATIRIDGDRLRGGDHTLCTLASVPENLAAHVIVTGTAIGDRKTTLRVDEEGNLILNITSDGLKMIIR